MNEKNYGIEILRILAMFMIVVIHIIGHSLLLYTLPGTTQYYAIIFVKIFVTCAVNIYGMISGYVMIDSKIKISSIIKIWIKVLFFNIVITLLFQIFAPDTIMIKDWIKACFPVIFQDYWYFTAYICMIAFTPFINSFFKSNPYNVQKKVFIILTILLSILPTLRNNDIFGTLHGYSPIWLLFLYFIGGFYKKNQNILNEKIKNKLYIFIYIFSGVVAFLSYYLISKFSLNYFNEEKGVEFLCKYTSPLIILCAFSLLVYFSNLKINYKIKHFIMFFSSSSFSVYLIHDNNLIRKYVIQTFYKYILNDNIFLMVLLLFIFSILLFYVCTIFDKIRICIFKFFNIEIKIENKYKDVI